jgi:hypothetical protein
MSQYLPRVSEEHKYQSGSLSPGRDSNWGYSEHKSVGKTRVKWSPFGKNMAVIDMLLLLYDSNYVNMKFVSFLFMSIFKIFFADRIFLNKYFLKSYTLTSSKYEEKLAWKHIYFFKDMDHF